MDPLNLDFLKDRYNSELARKDKLTDALGLPIAILIAFGSLISVMGTGFSYQGYKLKWWFELALAADCCAFAVCLVFLSIAYHRQDVAYLQTLGDLKNAWQTLQNADAASAAERFNEYIRASIIEAADLNAASNERRGGYIYRARASLLFVVALTGLVAIPYVVDQVKQPKRTPVVHIDNLDSKGTTNVK